jgi:menaquinone-specific isochorismate synthase
VTPVQARRRAVVRQLSDTDCGRLRARAHGNVFEQEGSGLFTFGRAGLIRLPEGLSRQEELAAASEQLMALAGPGTDGPELPIAVGALPFLPDRAGELVIPALSVVVGDRSEPALAISCDGEELLDALLDSLPKEASRRPPDRFELAACLPHEEFLGVVSTAIADIHAGALDKVVLAREVEIHANRPFRQGDLIERLRSLHPSCLTFYVDGFVGATPELLCRRTGRQVASYPLAGTAARSGDPEMDRRIESALLESSKDRAEHEAVVRVIVAALEEITVTLDVPNQPEIVALRNVSHLRTRITGELSADGDGRIPNVLQLLGRIHPTPAVAGSPVAVALEYLAKHENLDRDRYGGAVGWMRADGDGEFHLGIRSAILNGSSARLFAGVGIVADSDPESELRETQLKFQAMLAAAVRP